MTVLQVVENYGLEAFNKDYKDVYGQKHNLVNLSKLAKLDVKDVYINLITCEAIITAIGIEEL